MQICYDDLRCEQDQESLARSCELNIAHRAPASGAIGRAQAQDDTPAGVAGTGLTLATGDRYHESTLVAGTDGPLSTRHSLS
jgi:hypothetical protein